MSKVFNYYLDNEADRQNGVAIDVGMPEQPVSVWLGGSWDSHPAGYQSAQVRNADLEAITCYYQAYQQTPEIGHRITVHDGNDCDLGYTIYECVSVADEDAETEERWTTVEERFISAKEYIADQVCANLADDLLEAAREVGILDLDH